jgi:hypothetical protein
VPAAAATIGAMTKDKIARICWNTDGWRKPSGPLGKSKHAKAYERRARFGHEEWLLDTMKLIDGWHYGYLQPIGLHRDKYVGQTFNISLYSIENDTRTRWWVGRILDVLVTSPETSRDVYLRYKRQGWVQEMEEQLRSVGADVASFQRTKPEDFFVVQFRPISLDLLDSPMRFSKDDPVVTANYYILLNQHQAPRLLGNEKQFIFVAGHRKRKYATTSAYDERSTEIDLAHNRLQSAIYKHLSDTLGEASVGTELSTGYYGTRVDVVVRGKGNTFTFYEIKVSYSIRLCIREALGQLLEYAYYPGAENAWKLVVVSDRPITTEAQQYLASLRQRFGLPIYYQRYDPEKAVLEATEY